MSQSSYPVDIVLINRYTLTMILKYQLSNESTTNIKDLLKLIENQIVLALILDEDISLALSDLEYTGMDENVIKDFLQTNFQVITIESDSPNYFSDLSDNGIEKMVVHRKEDYLSTISFFEQHGVSICSIAQLVNEMDLYNNRRQKYFSQQSVVNILREWLEGQLNSLWTYRNLQYRYVGIDAQREVSVEGYSMYLCIDLTQISINKIELQVKLSSSHDSFLPQNLELIIIDTSTGDIIDQIVSTGEDHLIQSNIFACDFGDDFIVEIVYKNQSMFTERFLF